MRPLLSLASVAAVLALGTAGPAAAAPPQPLGQSPFSTGGGCTLCTAVQLTNSASDFSYVMPADGVLTKAGFYVGPFTEASDFAQARAFRKTGGSGATVIGQGAKHSLSGLSAGFHNFFERIPVAAGDVLGARFDSTPFIDGTPHVFTTGSGSDEAGTTTFPVDPEPGDSFTTSAFTGLRVNVRAQFETDEDHDGYGDTSQDLCPGSPAGATACSGILFGSDLQGAFNGGPGCTSQCVRVQRAVAGASTAAPFDGVVVRWRLLSAPPGAYGIRVLSPSAGPNHRITASSLSETVLDPGPTVQITTFSTRLPIPAGGYVGLAPPTFTGQPYREPTPGSSYVQVSDGPEGTEVSIAGPTGLNREVLYNADIEPDADHDGYGDISQDACPAETAAQGACSSGPSPATVPVIRDFRVKPKRFAVKVGGAVVSRRRVPAGTSLKLNLSERATVDFVVEKRRACGKGARKSCKSWKRVHSFRRPLAEGAGTVAYSGRYRRGGKIGILSPGGYRIGAIATNAAGNASAVARTSITVMP